MRKKFRSFIPLLAVLVFPFMWDGCKKESTPQPDLKVGDSYQGGIVFFVDATKKHGLLASTTDQSVTATWWNGSFLPTSAVSLSDGSVNTTKIIQAFGNTGTYAAKLCRDYKGGGATDWYLPSKDQLHTLYTQRVIVGGFSNDLYWSSSEQDTGLAWVQNFQDGTQQTDNISDAANVHTRAIRTF